MGPRSLVVSAIATLILIGLILIACGGGGGTTSNNGGGGGGNGGGGGSQQGAIRGVLKWKASTTGNGLYSNETTLTPQNVNPTQFGKKIQFHSDGVVMAQPLFVENLDMGAAGTHNVIIVASERDEVLAFDADGSTTQPLWRRSYLGPGVTTAPDNFGGRTNIGGEIGITGTPVIDTNTGAMYFVTTLVRNGTWEQWLRAIDIRTGHDYGPGSMQISATVPGDGPGSKNGQVPFDPGIQNQRAGLVIANGNVLVGWGSFSDWGVYRGWLMAFDTQTLKMTAAFSPATQSQSQDDGHGPADYGGGGSIWGGGASPALDSNGNIYVVPADGSFNADTGGKNYGDTVLKVQLSSGSFQVLDYFSPANRPCIDKADLEIGSGGFVLLPSDAAGGQQLGMVISKEGRLFLLNPGNLGKWSSDNSQIPQHFMVGNRQCFTGMGNAEAEGTTWQRLYGNPTYWNGSVYVAPSNATIKQYKFSGGKLSTTPASQGSTQFWLRGANTVVSSNGNSNGIVWAYTKNQSGVAEVRAYDASNLAHELWNNKSGPLFAGVPFGTPVVAGGRVIVPGRNDIVVYGLK
jgi:hypothetical protein